MTAGAPSWIVPLLRHGSADRLLNRTADPSILTFTPPARKGKLCLRKMRT